MDSVGIDESRLLNAAINLSRAPNNQITNGLVNQLFIFAKKNTDAPGGKGRNILLEKQCIIPSSTASTII